MSKGGVLRHIFRSLSPVEREQSFVLRKFYKTVGFVHFGHVHQHDDEYDAIRGFTSSLTHRDESFAVGTYGGYDIRMVNRADSHTTAHAKSRSKKKDLQLWTILEITLRVRNMPHIFFVPTGQNGDMYAKLFAEQPYMQPISSYTAADKLTPEFYGRYQILARSTRVQDVEELLSSPIIVGIGARFWPHGIEIEHGKLYIYIPDRKITKARLEHVLASSLWLADSLREAHEDIEE